VDDFPAGQFEWLRITRCVNTPVVDGAVAAFCWRRIDDHDNCRLHARAPSARYHPPTIKTYPTTSRLRDTGGSFVRPKQPHALVRTAEKVMAADGNDQEAERVGATWRRRL